MKSLIPIDIEASLLRIVETPPNDPETYIEFVRSTCGLLLDKYTILNAPNLHIVPDGWIKRATRRRDTIANNIGAA